MKSLCFISLLSLFFIGCHSNEEIKKIQAGQAEELSLYNRKVGVLPNGQVLYCTCVTNMDQFNTRTHYIYYTSGGTSISTNYSKVEGNVTVDQVQVTLSPEEIDILKKIVKDK